MSMIEIKCHDVNDPHSCKIILYLHVKNINIQ